MLVAVFVDDLGVIVQIAGAVGGTRHRHLATRTADERRCLCRFHVVRATLHSLCQLEISSHPPRAEVVNRGVLHSNACFSV